MNPNARAVDRARRRRIIRISIAVAGTAAAVLIGAPLASAAVSHNAPTAPPTPSPSAVSTNGPTPSPSQVSPNGPTPSPSRVTSPSPTAAPSPSGPALPSPTPSCTLYPAKGTPCYLTPIPSPSR